MDSVVAAHISQAGENLARIAGDPVRLAIWLDLHDLKQTAGAGLILAAIAADFTNAARRSTQPTEEETTNDAG